MFEEKKEMIVQAIAKARAPIAGYIRAVPEIILKGGGPLFFRCLHPQDKHGVRAPPTPRTRALINPPHYDPQDKLSPPLGHIVNKAPSPTGQKIACAPLG